MSLLSQLTAALRAGSIKVVDLTQPLGPDTPVIGLPEQFGGSPGVTMDLISRFDEKGPAWYWNVIHMGEHTGTHFDAPVHWITGKDLKDNSALRASHTRHMTRHREESRQGALHGSGNHFRGSHQRIHHGIIRNLPNHHSLA